MDVVFVRLFGIERENRSMLVYLLLQALLLGIYYGVFNIVAHSLFLTNFGADDLARAYAYTGLAGIALTYLYSLLKRWLRFQISSSITLFFVFLLTLFLSVMTGISTAKWLIYILFISLGPLFILTLMVFRKTTDLIFKRTPGQRLLRVTDSVLIMGFIAGSFSVPALLALGIDTVNILFVSTAGILLVLSLQFFLSARYLQEGKPDREQAKDTFNIKAFISNRYIRSLGIFAIISVMVLVFVQYSFLAAARLRYPGEADMAKFLGIFEGIMMLVALLANLFILNYLVKRRGLKIALTLSPVVIGILTVIAIVAGSGYGYMPEAQGFLLFFLLLALSRLFSRALDIALEKPALSLIYRTVNDDLRPGIQSAADGPVNELGVLISGILLVAFGAFSFTGLIHFSWLLALFIIVWIIDAFYLYRAYRVSLLKSAGKKRKEKQAQATIPYSNKPGSLCASGFFIDNNYFDLIVNPGVPDIIAEDNDLAELVLNKAEKTHNPDILTLLKNMTARSSGDNGIAERYDRLVRKIENKLEKEGIGKRKDLLSTIDRSKDRKLHLQAIVSQEAQPVVTDLMKLIRDQDNEIIRETLFIAGKFRIKELLPDICECLANPAISTDAYAVLKSFGRIAFPSLAGHFYRSSGNIGVRRLIIRLFSEAGSREAVDFILPGLWSANRLIKKESAVGLAKCGYRAGEAERKMLQEEIKNITGLIAWNLGAQSMIKRNNDNLLLQAMEEETDWLIGLLFDLLSVCYNRDLIQPVRENTGMLSLESINYSLELINIVADDDLKHPLTALINDLVPGEKQNNLSRFYPHDFTDYDSLVHEIINKDYNHIGVWAKACAIKSLYRLPAFKETDTLVALLFGGNQILREEAFLFLHNNYKDVYSSCSARLPDAYRKQLNEILDAGTGEHIYIFNRLMSLKGILPCIPGRSLVRLAESIKILSADEALRLDTGKDFLLWSSELDTDTSQKEVYINWDTAGRKFSPDDLKNRKGVYYLLPMSDVELFAYHNPDKAPKLINYIDMVLKGNKQLTDYN